VSVYKDILENIMVLFKKRTHPKIVDRGPGPNARMMTDKFLIYDKHKNTITVKRPGELRSWLLSIGLEDKYSVVMARRSQKPEDHVYLYDNGDGRLVGATYRYVLLPKIYSMRSL
jgi:hypothetical protein